MVSSVSVSLMGFLVLGGQVIINSSVCIMGIEVIVNGYFMIKEGCSK